MRCQLIKKNQRLGKKRKCKYEEGAQMKEDKTISAKKQKRKSKMRLHQTEQKSNRTWKYFTFNGNQRMISKCLFECPRVKSLIGYYFPLHTINQATFKESRLWIEQRCWITLIYIFVSYFCLFCCSLQTILIQSVTIIPYPHETCCFLFFSGRLPYRLL